MDPANAPKRGIGNNRDLSTKATLDEARSCNTRIGTNDKLPKSGQVRLCVHTCTVVSGTHTDKLTVGLTFIRGSRCSKKKKKFIPRKFGYRTCSRHGVIEWVVGII